MAKLGDRTSFDCEGHKNARTIPITTSAEQKLKKICRNKMRPLAVVAT